VQKFEQAQIEIVVLQEDLDKAKKEFENAEEDLKERSRNWETQVENIVIKLNNSFEKYMKALGFNGEVGLKKNGTFDQYELQMRVSFREGFIICFISSFNCVLLNENS
jgi:hypothetical protein